MKLLERLQLKCARSLHNHWVFLQQIARHQLRKSNVRVVNVCNAKASKLDSFGGNISVIRWETTTPDYRLIKLTVAGSSGLLFYYFTWSLHSILWAVD